jgi:hypothetical protein
MDAGKTRRETGFGREAAEVREPFTRGLARNEREKTQPNIARTITAKTAREAAVEVRGCGRVNTWPASG